MVIQILKAGKPEYGYLLFLWMAQMAVKFQTNFQIDGTNYLLEAKCSEAAWPRVIDKVHKFLERYGKYTREGFAGIEATTAGKAEINKETVKFQLTMNTKGLKIAVK